MPVDSSAIWGTLLARTLPTAVMTSNDVSVTDRLDRPSRPARDISVPPHLVVRGTTAAPRP